MRFIVALLLFCSIPAAEAASVPFIGCKSDGQTGPLEVPKGKPKIVDLRASGASEFAWYEGPGQGVLGPRGWSCAFVYGSSGSALLVRPEPFPDGGIIDHFEPGSSGFAVEIDVRDGTSSGRFIVANLISRAFPLFRNFAKEVRDLEPDLNIVLPAGPFAKDKLTYRSSRMVEFETPARREGLGTEFSFLRPSSTSIRGVAILIGDGVQNTPSALVVTTRLPASLRRLAPSIVREAEQESTTLR
jgi:hypothetical protein